MIDPARVARSFSRSKLLRALRDAARAEGWEIYAVGGMVRDALLGRPPHDIDLIVGPAAAPLAWLAARSAHRAVTFDKRILTHRFECDGVPVEVVERGERALAQELARRDFTVGAIAFDLRAWTLIDPLHGVDDLARGRLDPPDDERFVDDPLRTLRGVRLCVELPQLQLTERAKLLIRASATQLPRIATERVRSELERILGHRHASRGWRLADELGLLGPLFPEIEANRGLTQNRHHHLDVWQHSLLALEQADDAARLGRGVLLAGRDDPALSRDALLVLRWSLFFHDLGKAATRELKADGQATFYGHEKISAQIAARHTERLALPQERARAIETIVAQHLRLVIPPERPLNDKALVRIVREVQPWTGTLALHALADQAASHGIDHRRVKTELRRLARRLLEVEAQVAARQAYGRLVDGADVMQILGVAAGPRVGELLRQVEALRDEGRLTTRGEALTWLRDQVN